MCLQAENMRYELQNTVPKWLSQNTERGRDYRWVTHTWDLWCQSSVVLVVVLVTARTDLYSDKNKYMYHTSAWLIPLYWQQNDECAGDTPVRRVNRAHRDHSMPGSIQRCHEYRDVPCIQYQSLLRQHSLADLLPQHMSHCVWHTFLRRCLWEFTSEKSTRRPEANCNGVCSTAVTVEPRMCICTTTFQEPFPQTQFYTLEQLLLRIEIIVLTVR